jgi:dihydrofolate synthase/folylpolyglutamate synthase
MPQSIADVANEKGAHLHRVGQDWHYQVGSSDWSWRCEGVETAAYSALPLPNVPLANAATALAALHYSEINVSEDALRQGLQQASLPGRFQQVSESPRLILDVAHNPHAAGYLAGKLSDLPRQGGKVRAVIGMLLDKDIAGTLDCLKPQVDVWYCAPLEGPRGAGVAALTEHLPEAFSFTDVVSAWKQAMQDAESQDIVIVCGSFHTVAHVMAALDTGNTSGK